MRRLSFILIMCATLSAYAQESADQVLQRFYAKLQSSTLVSDFSIVVTDDASQPMNYNGSISMRDDRFILTMFGIEAAYDGKALYMYAEDVDELTISSPTQEDLLQANPMLFAKALQLQATVRFSSTAPEGQYSIDFVPNYQEAGVKKFVLRLNKKSLLPTEIQVREAKTSSTIRFRNASFSAEIPSFVLSKPSSFINDLR